MIRRWRHSHSPIKYAKLRVRHRHRPSASQSTEASSSYASKPSHHLLETQEKNGGRSNKSGGAIARGVEESRVRDDESVSCLENCHIVSSITHNLRRRWKIVRQRTRGHVTSGRRDFIVLAFETCASTSGSTSLSILRCRHLSPPPKGLSLQQERSTW